MHNSLLQKVTKSINSNKYFIMKKILLVAIIAVTTFSFSNAQELGVRFGGTNGAGGAAIDAVFSAGEFSRIHADLGFYKGGMGIDALWDFIYRPLNGESFNWYMGAGASTYLGDEFWLGASGEIGLEYRFNGAPIAMGIDWRPTLWIVNETKFGADSFGLNVRFVF